MREMPEKIGHPALITPLWHSADSLSSKGKWLATSVRHLTKETHFRYGVPSMAQTKVRALAKRDKTVSTNL